MKRAKLPRCLSVIALTIFICALPTAIFPISFRETSHGDRNKLPKSCQSCHKGHGIPGTPMLPTDRYSFCFRCHGDSATRAIMQQEGIIPSDVFLQNIQREFEKPYRHPIEVRGIHQRGETLPEPDPSIPRHAECVDCHHHHYVTEENKHLGIKGTNADGSRTLTVVNEYELCFNCHSYSANLPSDQTNKAALFATSNASYHPLIGRGTNDNVPSLLPPLSANSVIACTDCHGNDDPFGPKGPHGSNYERLLKKRFSTSDSSGSAHYDLCYSCHDQMSILRNDSFPLHNRHISLGASCRTCHNPHGSIRYTHLIDFSNLNVSPSSTGELNFVDDGDRAGRCYLSCHGVDHNDGTNNAYSPVTEPLSIQRLRKLK